MFEPVKAVLFDAVGTLIYPDPAVPDVYHSMGRNFGSKLSRDQIAQRFPIAFARRENGGPRPTGPDVPFAAGGDVPDYERPSTSDESEKLRWQHVVAEVFDDVPNATGPLFQSLWDHFAAGHHWKLYDDAALVWDRLRARGLLVGVASNFDRRLRNVCSQIGLLDDCRNLFWSSDVGFPKPSPRFFREVQRRMGLAPRQLLLVGDHPVNDFHGARFAGWHAILLDRSAHAGREPAAICATHVIHALTQLLSLLPFADC